MGLVVLHFLRLSISALCRRASQYIYRQTRLCTNQDRLVCFNGLIFMAPFNIMQTLNFRTQLTISCVLLISIFKLLWWQLTEVQKLTKCTVCTLSICHDYSADGDNGLTMKTIITIVVIHHNKIMIFVWMIFAVLMRIFGVHPDLKIYTGNVS